MIALLCSYVFHIISLFQHCVLDRSSANKKQTSALRKMKFMSKYGPAIKIAGQLESCNLVSLFKKKRVKNLLMENKIIKGSRSQP